MGFNIALDSTLESSQPILAGLVNELR